MKPTIITAIIASALLASCAPSLTSTTTNPDGSITKIEQKGGIDSGFIGKALDTAERAFEAKEKAKADKAAKEAETARAKIIATK